MFGEERVLLAALRNLSYTVRLTDLQGLFLFDHRYFSNNRFCFKT